MAQDVETGNHRHRQPETRIRRLHGHEFLLTFQVGHPSSTHPSRTMRLGLIPPMSTASDKDRFTRGLAIFSTVVSISAIVVSGYFAWKQYNLSEKVYDLSEKVFAQSQEDLQLSTMLDQKAPIDLKPPQESKVAGDPNSTMQLPPQITARYKALLSNRSLITVTIKSYQVACKTLDGKMWTITNDSLLTSDGAQIKAGTSIDAGKSLAFIIKSKCEISPDAFKLLKAKPMQSLNDADNILANHYMNLFGQTPTVQKMPDGMEVQTFTEKGYPMITVKITTSRDRAFSLDFMWNGNDIF